MTDVWNVRRMLAWMQEDFAKQGIESARLDAELLLAHALGVRRLQLYLDLERPLAAEERVALRELVRRRREREPVAYLVGRREFWKGSFRVDRRVLVPRPDTETLVERAVALLTREDARGASVGESHVETFEVVEPEPEVETTLDPGVTATTLERETLGVEATLEPLDETTLDTHDVPPPPEAAAREGADVARRGAVPSGPVVDLCTGSGCIVVSLAGEAPERVFHATDLSADALVVAQENAEEHGASVTFTHGDLFAGLTGPFALVVSNPPYVTDAEVETLEPEVARHEPRMALVGGADGLDVIRRLAEDAHARLMPGGALLIEIGADQGAATADVLRRAGFVDVRVIADLAGRDRVVEGWR